MKSSGEHLLLICHAFPPDPDIGGRRWAKFAKALTAKGHTVHVIAAEPPRDGKPSPWTSDVERPGIHIHRLPRRYPTVLQGGRVNSIREKVLYRIWFKLLPYLTKGNPLDPTIFWRAGLLRLSASLIREHDIRTVIASGAPFRSLFHVLELKRSFPDIHLIADLRDPWTWWDNYGHALLSPRRFAEERALERAVMEGADRVISPHIPVIDHLRKTYPAHASNFSVVPHAIDPDDLPKDILPRADGSFRFIYAGTLYGAEEALTYFNAVIGAFRTLEEQKDGTRKEVFFDLYITANDATILERMTRQAGLSHRIRFHEPVGQKEIFRKMAEADAALVFIPSKNKDLLGTKFQELFLLGIPVIHVGEPGVVSRTIEEHRSGRSLRIEQLAEELPRIVREGIALPDRSTYDASEVLLDRVTDLLLTQVIATGPRNVVALT